MDVVTLVLVIRGSSTSWPFDVLAGHPSICNGHPGSWPGRTSLLQSSPNVTIGSESQVRLVPPSTPTDGFQNHAGEKIIYQEPDRDLVVWYPTERIAEQIVADEKFNYSREEALKTRLEDLGNFSPHLEEWKIQNKTILFEQAFQFQWKAFDRIHKMSNLPKKEVFIEMSQEVFDVVVVGAGFSGLYILYELRKRGFSVKVFEEGSDLGGIWHWNSYPGARVDSDFFVYQFSHPELGFDFPWTQRFPGYKELQSYFAHVDERVNFRKNIQFNTRVTGATFVETGNEWNIRTSDGATTTCRHLILATGFASKRYVPQFKGLENFKGECHHTSYWPSDGQVEISGKRVAVIGTGASGVQVIQEIGPEVEHLTVYQRTPNLTIPMKQVNRSDSSSTWRFPSPSEYGKLLEDNLSNFTGLGFTYCPKNCMDQTPEEREAFFESLFEQGGLRFWLANYTDILVDPAANAIAYNFWQRKASARISDQRKRELLAPKVAPHFFGTKRPCLEQTYYEVLNQPNVDIVNIRESPILEVTETGIRTKKEGVVEVDIIVLATGFDNVTGGILDMDIVNGTGDTLRGKWAEGLSTHLGLMTNGFPNMFFMYGPQAPTAFSNGPTTGKIQGDWIAQLLVSLRKEKKVRIEPTKEAEAAWIATVAEKWNESLFALTPSLFTGDNIPGKKHEPLNYAGGIPKYIERLEGCKNANYDGFIIS